MKFCSIIINWLVLYPQLIQYKSSIPSHTYFSTPVLDECFTNTVKKVTFLCQPRIQMSSVSSQTLSGVQKDSISTYLCNRFTAFLSTSCQEPDKAFTSEVCNSYTSPCTALPLVLLLTLLYDPFSFIFLHNAVWVGHCGISKMIFYCNSHIICKFTEPNFTVAENQRYF